ncbi:MAG: flavodoxin-dependent (E)-4-hydroxy-3-methylbut-2-enyl-diphosphate synthase [Phycisphaerae bacterium]|nr:flavodoxin-dependent (E)-4-hydroxy-3-methylbut-2-enyl-diphosphate synthase [Phycisphaerae bacterium]
MPVARWRRFGTISGVKIPEITRRKTRALDVGGVVIGGGAPVRIQSMTNTPTRDAAATLEQIRQLAGAGAELVRVAVPRADDTAALTEIVAESPVPIIADVHFHFDRALEAIAAGVAKIRLNPGNIADRSQVLRIIDAAGAAGVAIRVGVNEGSVVDRREGEQRNSDLAASLVELMVAKLAGYLEVFEASGFDRLVLSAKSHDAVTTVAVNRLLSARWDWPLHLGVTHAGTPQTGAIRSAAAMGALLCDGIGDTIRISYAGDPVVEVEAARELLASLRLRQRVGIELIACPTCGRLETDITDVAEEIRKVLADVTAPITVAIMGCVVNGPGEAAHADVAVCAGKDKVILYNRGKRIRTVSADKIVEAVVAEVRNIIRD